MKFTIPGFVLSFGLCLLFNCVAETSQSDVPNRLSPYVSLAKELGQDYKRTFAQQPNCEAPSLEELKNLLMRLNQDDNIYGKSSLEEIAKQISWNRIEFLEKERDLLQKEGDQLGHSLEKWYSALKWSNFFWWASDFSCKGYLDDFYATGGLLSVLFSASQNLVAADCIKNEGAVDDKTKLIEKSIAEKEEKLINRLAFLEPRITQCINEPK